MLTEEALMRYLSAKMGIDTKAVAADTPLFSSGLLDSFSMVDLLMFIESEAAMRLEPDDVTMDNLDTVGSILRMAARRGQGS